MSGLANAVRFAAFVLLFAGIPLAAAGQSSAQDLKGGERRAHLEPADRTLAELIKLLSDKFDLDIIADGEPTRHHASIGFEGTLRDLVDRMCELFDYSWSSAKGGAIRMTKRFRDQKQLPQMHSKEMELVGERMAETLRALGYDPSRFASDFLQVLGDSFRPDQLALLRNGGFLASGDLSREQGRIVASAIFSRAAYSTCFAVDTLYMNLRSMPLASLTASPLQATNPYTGEVFSQPPLLMQVQDRSGRWVGASLVLYPPFIEKGN